jgi:tripartite-type tricarboxylate transporter receptor subunit TctC
MRSFIRLAGLIAATLALASYAAPAIAQADYPARPITVIVPFAAGGPSDTVARIFSDHMSRTLGQQMVIENVVGAGGTVGTIRAARATPDGYTVILGHLGTHVSAVGL